MKKLTLIKFTLVGFLGYIVVCGYHAGAASTGYDCTGAEVNNGTSNPSNCANNGSCHGSSTSIGVTIELDSAGGKATTHYVGGGSYTIKLSGVNNGSTSLPYFGFQLAATKGTTAGSTVTNAGSFPSPYPTTCTLVNSFNASYCVCNIVEQTNRISRTSGSGGSGTTYVESIKWTAPAKGTGAVSLWGVINAVNGNGNADRGDLSNNTQLVLNEWTSLTGVNNIVANHETIVFPNPVSSYVTFTLQNEVNNASVTLYNINGQTAKQVTFSGKEVTLDRGTLASGLYFYTIVDGGQRIKTGKLVIQ